MDIHVDGEQLTLHVKPYFLRLTFSHRLVEDDESSARYDPSSGYLTIVLTKEVPGEHFKDLDLLARLLTPSTGSKGHIMSSSSQKQYALSDGPSSAQHRLEELSFHANDTEKAFVDSASSHKSYRPLIEVISETGTQDPDDELQTEPFTPSEDLLKERAILLEGVLCKKKFLFTLTYPILFRKPQRMIGAFHKQYPAIRCQL